MSPTNWLVVLDMSAIAATCGTGLLLSVWYGVKFWEWLQDRRYPPEY
jgi:hypothetical protein